MNIRYILFILLFALAHKANATHIYGGDLLYTHVSGNTYKITLTIYGDCEGSAFGGLAKATPRVAIFNGVVRDTIALTEDTNARAEVSAVCPNELINTTCNPNGKKNLPGVTRFIYEGMAQLPPAANWSIVFFGILSANNSAGRSNSITNIVLGRQGQIMFLTATLNNQNGPNSSPQYTTIPTPYYCINIGQQYNQGASDADGDSLSFSLVPAATGINTFATYIPPYTAIAPLATAQGGFTFDNISGQLSFTPNSLQRSVVVTKVDEYKNGVLVGSSLREMTFIIIDNCSNTPPTGAMDTTNISGGLVDSVNNKTVNVCLGEPSLQFRLNVSDPDKDNVSIKLNNLPQGMTVNVANNGTRNPIIYFTWNTQSMGVGLYNFYATYQDTACPLSSSQTLAYTIRIVPPPSLTHKVMLATRCVYKEKVAFDVVGGTLPRTVIVKNLGNGRTEAVYVDSTGYVEDSFAVGMYEATVYSNRLKCNTSYRFNVVDSGTYPESPLANDIHTCLNEPVQEIRPRHAEKGILKWYTAEGDLLSEPPTYTTNEVKGYTWYVSQKIDTCESERSLQMVEVHPLPTINISNIVNRICIGDSITLMATGGVRYEWLPSNKVVHTKDSTVYSLVKDPQPYTVIGYDQYNCASTDTIAYKDIDLCCRFNYPNAFTPNNDGVNDKWRPIIYGNVDEYQLRIFDRWGKMVFESNSPRDGWDGTNNGKACDIGAYYYLLRSHCVAGQHEKTTGDVIIIR